MIRGVVRPSRTDGSGLEAWIEISVIGDDGASRPLEVVADTGFTGWLTVPPSTVPLIGVHPSGKRYGTLANGQVDESDFCDAVVLWHDNPVDVWVDIMENVPLIGTDLLAGSRLSIDWWDGGDVIIEERTPPAA